MKSWLAVVVVVGLMLVWAFPLLALTITDEPSRGTAVVDGRYAEWNLARDFFTNMYRAGDPTKALESKCYLRYDCTTNTMYVLVLAEPGVDGTIVSGSATSWVAIDENYCKVVNENANRDGIPPDFAWIDRGFDGNPLHVRGYEASFTMTPGCYLLLVHMNVWDEESQTSATIGNARGGAAIEVPSLPSAVEPVSFGGIKALYY